MVGLHMRPTCVITKTTDGVLISCHYNLDALIALIVARATECVAKRDER